MPKQFLEEIGMTKFNTTPFANPHGDATSVVSKAPEVITEESVGTMEEVVTPGLPLVK